VGTTLTSDDATLTETDADGFFALQGAGAYQVLIIEPDGSAVSFYDRLEQPEPVLVHQRSEDSEPPTALASVSGSLSGGTTYPLTNMTDLVSIYLLSSAANERVYVRGDSTSRGPEYGLTLGFDSDATPATLLALGTFVDPSHPETYSAAATIREVTLQNGDAQTLDLELAPLQLALVSGQVNVPDGWDFAQTQEYYRFPVANAVIDFPMVPYTRTNPFTNQGSFEYELPDLTALDGTLCVVGVGHQDDGLLWWERCGPLAGLPLSFDFEEPPTLSEPVDGAMFAGNTRFTWSRRGSESAPMMVELQPEQPTAATPAIHLFSVEAAVSLPSLEAWGVKLIGGAVYKARIVALGSGAGSQAFGPNGLGATIPREWRMSYSSARSLSVAP
jgi:hypothetical protein